MIDVRKISTKDIYSKVYLTIIKNRYWQQDINMQKEILKEALKDYMVSKLQLMGLTFLNSSEDLDIVGLFEALSKCIYKESNFKVLSNFINCILDIAGDMQGYCIIWEISDNNQSPIAEFDENGILYKLITNKKTDCVSVFEYVYKLFMNDFMERKHIKTL